MRAATGTAPARAGAGAPPWAPRTEPGTWWPAARRLAPRLALVIAVAFAAALEPGAGRTVGVGLVVAAALVDAHARRIPNILVLSALACALAAAPSGPAALAGATLCAAPFLALAVARPAAMGMGDAKLALAAGALAGVGGAGALLLATVVLGGLTAIVVAAVRGPRAAFAYGPAIAVALLLVIR